jgi:hypothetical protein
MVFEEIERRGGRGAESGFEFVVDDATCFLLANELSRVVCCPTQSRGRVRFQSVMTRFVKVSESPTTTIGQQDQQRTDGETRANELTIVIEDVFPFLTFYFFPIDQNSQSSFRLDCFSKFFNQFFESRNFE